MKWTQAHSRNAVAAKARKRIAENDVNDVEPPKFARIRTIAKWRIQIRDLEHGDSLTLSLSPLPWRGRYVDGERREYSARSIAHIIQAILQHAP